MSSGCSMFVCVLLFIWGAIEKVWLSNEVGKISRSIWFCRVVQRSSTLYVHGMVFQYCPSVSSLSPGAVSYISNMYISLRVYVHHEGIANTLSSGESKLGLRGLRILISPTGTYMSSQSTSSHVESTPGILKLEMHVVNSPQQATQCKGEEWLLRSCV